MRVCVFSTLYPNSSTPRAGLFVERRLLSMLAAGGLEAEVLAPVPWFPATHPAFGRYADHARVERAEKRAGLSVLHPRYLVIPKVGELLAPATLAYCALGALRNLRRRGLEFDVIDAHFFYPDGVAAAIASRMLGIPLVITARGSDVNLSVSLPLQRRMIRWAASVARSCVTVSEALKTRLVDFGVPPSRIQVVRNGVDLAFFRPLDRATARAGLGVEGRVALSVGNLVELKGHHLAVEAVARTPGWTLLIAGAGPQEQKLRSRIASLGLEGRVRLLGSVSPEALVQHYSASDLLLLGSSREGMPNVLLEAMACGLPVAATAVGGIPEVVVEGRTGFFIDERSAEGVARALRRFESMELDRDTIRRQAMAHGWEATAAAHTAVLRAAVETP